MSNSKDTEVFRNAMKDVKPLEHEERVQERKRPLAKARYSRADKKDVLHESLGGDLNQRDALEQSGEEAAYCGPVQAVREPEGGAGRHREVQIVRFFSLAQAPREADPSTIQAADVGRK